MLADEENIPWKSSDFAMWSGRGTPSPFGQLLAASRKRSTRTSGAGSPCTPVQF